MIKDVKIFSYHCIKNVIMESQNDIFVNKSNLLLITLLQINYKNVYYKKGPVSSQHDYYLVDTFSVIVRGVMPAFCYLLS